MKYRSMAHIGTNIQRMRLVYQIVLKIQTITAPQNIGHLVTQLHLITRFIQEHVDHLHDSQLFYIRPSQVCFGGTWEQGHLFQGNKRLLN